MRIHQLYIKECVSVVWATRDYHEVDTQREPKSDLERVFESAGCLLVTKRNLDKIKPMLVQPHYYWYSIAVNPRRNDIEQDNTIWQWIRGDALSPHRVWERHLIESRSKSFNMPKKLTPPAEEALRAVHQTAKTVRLFDVMEQPLFNLRPPSASVIPYAAVMAERLRDAVRVIKKEPTSERRVE